MTLTNWERYERLSAEMEGRLPGVGDDEADRFHSAGTYANWCEGQGTADTDEQWAEMFWTAYDQG